MVTMEAATLMKLHTPHSTYMQYRSAPTLTPFLMLQVNLGPPCFRRMAEQKVRGHPSGGPLNSLQRSHQIYETREPAALGGTPREG